MDRTLHAALIFQRIYQDINGYAISGLASDEEKKNYSLLYGEVPFLTWKQIVKCANPKKDGVFFDLGSGVGRVAMLSHLLFDFQKCVGIELVEPLHQMACVAQYNFGEEPFQQALASCLERDLDFICGDIFDADLSPADFIFLNYPFKNPEVLKKLEEKMLQELKPKTKIVTVLWRLKNPAFTLLSSDNFKFSWGKSPAYFYEV